MTLVLENKDLLWHDIEHLGPQVYGGELVDAGQDEVEAGGLGATCLDQAQAENDPSLVLLYNLKKMYDVIHNEMELTLMQTQSDQGSVTMMRTQEHRMSRPPHRPRPGLLESSGEEPVEEI